LILDFGFNLDLPFKTLRTMSPARKGVGGAATLPRQSANWVTT